MPDLRRVARAARGDRPGHADHRTCAARAGASSRSTARSRRSARSPASGSVRSCALRRYRRLALEIMTEAVAVATRRGHRAREGRRHARPRLDRAHRRRSHGDRLGEPDREARAAARRRAALPPDALVDARRDRARPDAGDRLPQRRGRDARRSATASPTPVNAADRRDRVGDRGGPAPRRRATPSIACAAPTSVRRPRRSRSPRRARAAYAGWPCRPGRRATRPSASRARTPSPASTSPAVRPGAR